MKPAAAGFYDQKSLIHAAEKVVVVAVVDIHMDDVARFYAADAADVYHAVDFRRVVGRAANGAVTVRIHAVDDDRQHVAHFFREQTRADFRLFFHEALPAFFFDGFRHGAGQGVRRGTVHR